MMQVDYKALGSLPREHETLIPFKQLVNKFFSLLSNGEKAKGANEGRGITPGEGRTSKEVHIAVQNDS